MSGPEHIYTADASYARSLQLKGYSCLYMGWVPQPGTPNTHPVYRYRYKSADLSRVFLSKHYDSHGMRVQMEPDVSAYYNFDGLAFVAFDEGNVHNPRLSVRQEIYQLTYKRIDSAYSHFLSDSPFLGWDDLPNKPADYKFRQVSRSFVWIDLGFIYGAYRICLARWKPKDRPPEADRLDILYYMYRYNALSKAPAVPRSSTPSNAPVSTPATTSPTLTYLPSKPRFYPCPDCDGTGQAKYVNIENLFHGVPATTCFLCRGSGKLMR